MNALYEELKQYPQWVSWKVCDNTKVPINPQTGSYASVNDSATWSCYGKIRNDPHKGFVLTEDDPFTCIDLDHCVEAHGQIRSQTTKILMYFQSYTELSPSGTGLHVWVKGKMPAAIKRKEFEFYTQDRYMTVMFDPIFNYPVADKQKQLDAVWGKYGKEVLFKTPEGDIVPCNCIEDLRKLYKQSESFRRIFHTQCEFEKADGTPDHSKYDMAIANLIQTWSTEKIVWAVQYIREKHRAKPKHIGAILLTIGKVRNG